MANKYPYVASAGPLSKTIEQLRRSFPKEVTADTLRRLGVAPKNESYVINVLRFLGVIDGEGKKVEANAATFLQHKEEAFASAFEGLVRDAYKELFDLHGENAWNLDKGSLTQFFRTSDHSTEVVGSRQAGTFTYLATLAGHNKMPAKRDRPSEKNVNTDKSRRQSKSKSAAPMSVVDTDANGTTNDGSRFGLTVRVEVNLPAEGDEQTYDSIFRSIRKNLIDAQ